MNFASLFIPNEECPAHCLKTNSLTIIRERQRHTLEAHRQQATAANEQQGPHFMVFPFFVVTFALQVNSRGTFIPNE